MEKIDVNPQERNELKTTRAYQRDPAGNEISPGGKLAAGIVLIVFTLFSALYIVGHWPDRLAAPREHVKPLYTYEWFHVRLVGIPDTGKVSYINDSTILIEKSGTLTANPPKRDTIAFDTTKNVTTNYQIKIKNDSLRKLWRETDSLSALPVVAGKKYPPEHSLIHINTLLLILVAFAGFLGNMIHIATSFTTFIGSGDFKRSWLLWYCVKPFTAAALAIGIYFVFRGGFLNMSDDSTNINLYGLMTISLLAGLFTDRTTLKLKEVFDVLLQPKEERKDALGETSKVLMVKADILEAGKPAMIIITGQFLNKKGITIKIGDQSVTGFTALADSISFTYTLPDALKDKRNVKLFVYNDKGTELFVQELPVKGAAAVETNNGQPQNPVETDDIATSNEEEFGEAEITPGTDPIVKE